jgi:hypothetical protein
MFDAFSKLNAETLQCELSEWANWADREAF